MMQWAGKWRPVIHMFDAQNIPTTLAQRAAKCVLWCNEPPDNGFVPLTCSPGEIVERFDRDPDAREWDYITEGDDAILTSRD